MTYGKGHICNAHDEQHLMAQAIHTEDQRRRKKTTHTSKMDVFARTHSTARTPQHLTRHPDVQLVKSNSKE